MERVTANIVDRMIRAAKLDNRVYEELERDTDATGQALIVVTLVAIASGIGGLLAGAIRGTPGATVTGFIFGIVSAIVAWAIWSLVTYFIGTALFGGTANWGELLRTIGFAYTPNILQIFSFIPIIGWLIGLGAAIWALVAGVVAVRQALDFSTGKAVLTIVISWIVVFIALLILTFLLSIVGMVF